MSGEETADLDYADMEIAAKVVIYARALSDTERQNVQDYLKSKYGLGA